MGIGNKNSGYVLPLSGGVFIGIGIAFNSDFDPDTDFDG